MTNEIRPEHYKDCSIECIEAMAVAFGPENVVNFCAMNAFKYLWRHKNKNGLEDLKKARTYIDLGNEWVANCGTYSSSTVTRLDNVNTVVENYFYTTEED